MLGSGYLASAIFWTAAAGAITKRQEFYTASVQTVTVQLSSIIDVSSSTATPTTTRSSVSITTGPASLSNSLTSSTSTSVLSSTSTLKAQNDRVPRPEHILEQPDVEQSGRNMTMSRVATSPAVAPPAGTYRNVVYFTNWGIYGANHQPSNIQAGAVTHLLYSFADIRPNGDVVSSDSYADTEKRYPGDVWGEAGTNAYGCVKQLFLIKKKYRKFKVLLSIGGWTWSPKFVPVAATDAGRRRFASSAVALMGDWGFDGLDIDWEYPQNPTEANNFVLLLQACREALDAYAAANARGYRFSLTVAVPAGKPNYEKLNMRGMAPYVDGWHLMAYDYSGSWDTTTGHQSNLYAATKYASAAVKADTDSALRYYLSQGIDSRKIMLGLPLYGRSFANTDGMGKPFNGMGQGSIERGIWHYKALPLPGASEGWDAKAGASWSYDPRTREAVSYDNPKAAKVKTAYLLSKNLGGAIFWESSGDKTGTASLIRTVAKGVPNMDPTNNLLSYPASRYDNIKRQMR